MAFDRNVRLMGKCINAAVATAALAFVGPPIFVVVVDCCRCCCCGCLRDAAFSGPCICTIQTETQAFIIGPVTILYRLVTLINAGQLLHFW